MDVENFETPRAVQPTQVLKMHGLCLHCCQNKTKIMAVRENIDEREECKMFDTKKEMEKRNKLHKTEKVKVCLDL